MYDFMGFCHENIVHFRTSIEYPVTDEEMIFTTMMSGVANSMFSKLNYAWNPQGVWPQYKFFSAHFIDV